MMILEVLATEVQVGDKVIDLSEVDYIVREVSRRSGPNVPDAINKHGGWVSIVGDSDDGYFEKHYDGEEDYYAAPTQVIKVER
jgi:hypothetical protein